MKKAIVTGATGFIGAAFVKLLTDKGIDVIALGRKPITEVKDSRREKLAFAEYINLDMREIGSLHKRLHKISWDVGAECVFFHLAWAGVDRLSDLDIEAQMKNVGWAVNALEQSVKIGCVVLFKLALWKRLSHISTSNSTIIKILSTTGM